MQKNIYFPILACLLIVCTKAYSQDPVPIRQFYFNPYLFNPSFNASNGYTEMGLIYRKQWVNINDAPTISGFNIQIPTGSKVSLGLNFISQEIIALRNSTFMATYGYSIPLQEDQFLRFAISVGPGMNNLNLKEGDYDPNDPVIINAQQNNFYIDGNFGISYTIKNFNIGFALPKLFKPSFISSTEFEVEEFSPFDYQLASVSSKFKTLRGLFSIEPIIIYKNSNNLSSFDFATLLHYKEKVSIGGTYGTTQGLGFLLGMKINTFRFGYGFELPPPNSDLTNTTSHEIQLSVRFGNNKSPRYTGKTKSVPAPEQYQDVATPSTKESMITDSLTENKSNQVVPQPSDKPTNKEIVAEVIEEEKEKYIPSNSDLIKSPPRTFKLSTGHYVIGGVFRNMKNATGYAQELVLMGYADAHVGLHPEKDLYYVYVFSSYNLDEAKQKRNQFRLTKPLNDVWIMTIEKAQKGK